jgi:hypothetical protein
VVARHKRDMIKTNIRLQLRVKAVKTQAVEIYLHPTTEVPGRAWGIKFVTCPMAERLESFLSQSHRARTMTNIEKLLSISSEPLADRPDAIAELLSGYSLGAELFQMLEQKNGFYAFEFALHVFPLTSDPETGLESWNAESLWRNEYVDLAEGLLFFAEDSLQDQFCLSKKQTGVYRFHAETGRLTLVADSVENWAAVILSKYKTETGWILLHEWQQKNGPLPLGRRLMPKVPFFLGGAYEIENLWAGNPLEGMRLKGDLAIQTRDLPDGATVKLNVGQRP